MGFADLLDGLAKNSTPLRASLRVMHDLMYPAAASKNLPVSEWSCDTFYWSLGFEGGAQSNVFDSSPGCGTFWTTPKRFPNI